MDFSKLKEYSLVVLIGLGISVALIAAYFSTQKTQIGSESITKVQNSMVSAVQKTDNTKSMTTIAKYVLPEISTMNIGYTLDATKLVFVSGEKAEDVIVAGFASETYATTGTTVINANAVLDTQTLTPVLIQNQGDSWTIDGNDAVVMTETSILTIGGGAIAGMANSNELRNIAAENKKGYVNSGYFGFAGLTKAEAEDLRDSYFNQGEVISFGDGADESEFLFAVIFPY